MGLFEEQIDQLSDLFDITDNTNKWDYYSSVYSMALLTIFIIAVSCILIKRRLFC